VNERIDDAAMDDEPGEREERRGDRDKTTPVLLP
jgi:hypothetical protein